VGLGTAVLDLAVPRLCTGLARSRGCLSNLVRCIRRASVTPAVVPTLVSREAGLAGLRRHSRTLRQPNDCSVNPRPVLVDAQLPVSGHDFEPVQRVD
jgi:hypothetical protein